MQQMREVINAKETAAASNLTSTQPISQQQQIATPTTVGSSESPTPSSNAGKVATPKKQPAEKVTVRTLPKKQVASYLVILYIVIATLLNIVASLVQLYI